MKTIREGTAGKAKLRLVRTDKDFVALTIEGGQPVVQARGSDADAVWGELQAKLTREGPDWFGYAGARERFLHWFAGGFRSPAYVEDERDYKLAAKTRLEKTAPVEEAATGSGQGEAILAAYRATSLLYPIEKTRLQSLLRGSDADAFVRAAARFALGEGKASLKALETLLRPHDNAKWTVVTYLPFLWRPDAHIFLKPEVTKDFAARVMHPFEHVYDAGLDWRVYESLIDLAGQTRTVLADLAPRDMIDVQGLIFVAGGYQEGREVRQA